MGMSSYIMDTSKTSFGIRFVTRLKSDWNTSMREAMDFAVTLGKTEVPDTETIEDGVSDAWNEVWSKY